MDTKKVVIVDDHALIRQGLRSLLSSDDAFEVVSEAGDGMEAIRCVENHKPDLVLLDLAMRGIDGVQAIREIKRRFPEVKILVLTSRKSEDYVLEAIQSGADGYCLKDATYEELQIAMKSVLSGQSYLSPAISEKVLKVYLEGTKSPKPASSFDSLTERERTVLKLISEGYTNKAIADYLSISVKTVDKHRSNLMKKLDLHNASALTAYAIDKGIATSVHECRPREEDASPSQDEVGAKQPGLPK